MAVNVLRCENAIHTAAASPLLSLSLSTNVIFYKKAAAATRPAPMAAGTRRASAALLVLFAAAVLVPEAGALVELVLVDVDVGVALAVACVLVVGPLTFGVCTALTPSVALSNPLNMPALSSCMMLEYAARSAESVGTAFSSDVSARIAEVKAGVFSSLVRAAKSALKEGLERSAVALARAELMLAVPWARAELTSWLFMSPSEIWRCLRTLRSTTRWEEAVRERTRRERRVLVRMAEMYYGFRLWCERGSLFCEVGDCRRESARLWL